MTQLLYGESKLSGTSDSDFPRLHEWICIPLAAASFALSLVIISDIFQLGSSAIEPHFKIPELRVPYLIGSLLLSAMSVWTFFGFQRRVRHHFLKLYTDDTSKLTAAVVDTMETVKSGQYWLRVNDGQYGMTITVPTSNPEVYGDIIRGLIERGVIATKH